MLVEPSQRREIFRVEPPVSSSMVPQAPRKESEPDPVTPHPPLPSILDSTASQYPSVAKLVFRKPASFVGRAIRVADGYDLRDGTGASNAHIGFHRLPLLMLA